MKENVGLSEESQAKTNPAVNKFTGKEKLSLESLGSFVKESLDPGNASPAFEYQDKLSTVPEQEPVLANISRVSSTASRSSQGSQSSVKEDQKSEFKNILTAFPQVVNGRGVSVQNERHSVTDFRCCIKLRAQMAAWPQS